MMAAMRTSSSVAPRSEKANAKPNKADTYADPGHAETRFLFPPALQGVWREPCDGEQPQNPGPESLSLCHVLMGGSRFPLGVQSVIDQVTNGELRVPRPQSITKRVLPLERLLHTHYFINLIAVVDGRSGVIRANEVPWQTRNPSFLCQYRVHPQVGRFAVPGGNNTIWKEMRYGRGQGHLSHYEVHLHQNFSCGIWHRRAYTSLPCLRTLSSCTRSAWHTVILGPGFWAKNCSSQNWPWR